MNKGFGIFLKTISVIRLLTIPMLFILIKLWRDSIPDDGPFRNLKIDIQFSFWEYLFVYVVTIVFPVNTVISLLLSFKPKWVMTDFLKRKNFLLSFYIPELITLTVLLYLSYKKIQENFFPKQTTYLGEVLSWVFPGDGGISIYEKLMAVDFCVLAFCSLVFVSFFWKFYRAQAK